MVALLIFWPSKDSKHDKDAKSGKTASSAQGRAGKGESSSPRGARGQGGVAARDADKPLNPNGQEHVVRRNPAIPLPNLDMAPAVPDVKPVPKFETTEEEIAYWEKKLTQAQSQLAMRERAVQRVEKIKEKVDRGEHDQDQYLTSKKIVDKNLANAKKKVDSLQTRLAGLREE